MILFPYYQYLIDPDAIGYAAIATKIAKGDFFESINGLWSPMSAWLSVPFVKAGISPYFAFKYVNGIAGILLLASIARLLKNFTLPLQQHTYILITCVPILIGYCFYELCADFLLLLFFTLYLIQITKRDFFSNASTQLFAAAIAVAAYLTKAYFLPFFMVHYAAIHIVHHFADRDYRLRKAVVASFKGIFVFLILASPWIIVLSIKYNTITYSTAGIYNTYLHFTKENLFPDILIPPTYPDSLTAWEDPYRDFMKTVSALYPIDNIVMLIKNIAYNIFHSFRNMIEISVFSPLILITVFFVSIMRKKSWLIEEKTLFLFITSIILPAGYLTLHLETRFIWMLSITCLIMGNIIFTKIFSPQKSSITRIIAICLLNLSFTIGPIISLKEGWNSGKDYYSMAAVLENNNIKGNVTCNYIDMPRYNLMLISNVLVKNKFFSHSTVNYTEAQFIQDLKKFDINFYFHTYTSNTQKQAFLQSNIYKQGLYTDSTTIPGTFLVKLK